MSGVNNYDDNFEKSIEDIRRRIQKISREMGWGDYYIHHKSPSENSENFDDLFETTSETNEKKPDSQESIDAKKARENALNNIKKQLMGK